MEIKRATTTTTGSPDYFIGSVTLKPLFQVGSPLRLGGSEVTFAPGAHTVWHTHPRGQTLIVTAGEGWVQAWGKPVQELRPGDVVWTEPGEKHWHGAKATSSMTHLAIQEALDGKSVQWMEKVGEYPSF